MVIGHVCISCRQLYSCIIGNCRNTFFNKAFRGQIKYIGIGLFPDIQRSWKHFRTFNLNTIPFQPRNVFIVIYCINLPSAFHSFRSLVSVVTLLQQYSFTQQITYETNKAEYPALYNDLPELVLPVECSNGTIMVDFY